MYEEFDRDLHCRDEINPQQDQWPHLHPTAQTFLQNLNLSPSHPHCHDNETYTSEEYLIPHMEGLMSSSSDYVYEKNMHLGSKLYTIWCQVSPALLAMSELWLRLFAFVLAPLIIVYLMTCEFLTANNDNNVGGAAGKQSTMKTWSKKEERKQGLIIVIGLASSLVLLTDTMYVFCNNGRHIGASCFTSMLILSYKRCSKFQHYHKRIIISIFSIICLTWYLLSHSKPYGNGIYDHPGLDVPTIQPGFYYSKQNKLMVEIANQWSEESRTYDVSNGATPYLPTGDSLTGIPFLVNKSEKLDYERVWVQNEIDKEAVALDIRFPVDGIHDEEKPLFLILHGLNGGSHEDYVLEFVRRRMNEGHTCIVMIARGLMDTPVIG